MEKYGYFERYEKKDFSALIGLEGFSDALLNNHFKLYSGYVANTNKLIEKLDSANPSSPEYAELKRRFGWEFNGMRLHELYFGNMSRQRNALDQNGALAQKISKSFGSYEKWESDFRAVGSLRGIGWVVLYFDAEKDSLFNTWINEHDAGHLSGAVPLVVMDVFEHAFMLDYGLDKKSYIDAFFNAIDWAAVEKRLQ